MVLLLSSVLSSPWKEVNDVSYPVSIDLSGMNTDERMKKVELLHGWVAPVTEPMDRSFVFTGFWDHSVEELSEVLGISVDRIHIL